MILPIPCSEQTYCEWFPSLTVREHTIYRRGVQEQVYAAFTGQMASHAQLRQRTGLDGETVRSAVRRLVRLHRIVELAPGHYRPVWAKEQRAA